MESNQNTPVTVLGFTGVFGHRRAENWPEDELKKTSALSLDSKDYKICEVRKVNLFKFQGKINSIVPKVW